MENNGIQFNQIELSRLNLGRLSIQTYWPDGAKASESIITVYDSRLNQEAWGNKIFEGTLAQLIDILANSTRPSEYGYEIGATR